GKWYRFSTTVFALGFTYLFLLIKAYYLNHGYLFCLLSFAMIFLPANRAFSLDVVRHPKLARSTIPFWPLFLLRFMMGLVYFYGGIAKINFDWLQAMPLKTWLQAKAGMPLLGPLWRQEWVAYGMSYGGLLLDLLAPFLLSYRSSRKIIFAFILFFHFTNFILFKIGIFPFLSIALSLLFFPPDFPRRVIRWAIGHLNKLEDRLPKVYQLLLRAAEPPTLTQQAIPIAPRKKVLIRNLLLLFCSIQLLLPLRHHYFPGPVAWTEEGHRYSWRMMLRDKNGYGYFEVRGTKTDEYVKVKPTVYLNKRQKRKLYTHPDMILQFAHFLRDEYQAKWQEEVEVYAQIKVRLNGRKYQRYIDPGKNLAKVEWSFWQPSEWIEPMKASELPR
ncbi:MAG: HTTM domain-containing protein, partial [Bacteroidota bacterium]